MPVGGMAVGSALGLGQMIYAKIQQNKLNKQLEANAALRPKYEINPEEYQMQSLAENRANSGMSDASRTAYMNDANAGLSNTTDAILKAGGNPNSIGSAYGSYEKGIGKLAMYDDEMRMKNLAALNNQWARMSATRDKQWQINEEIPWKDKQAALAGQVQGANGMFNAGMNTLGSGIMGLAGNLMSRNAGNNPSAANGSIDQLPVMGARQLPTGNMFNNNPYSLNFTPMSGVPLPSWMNTGAQPYGMMSSSGGDGGGDIGWNNGLPQTF